MSIKLDLKDRQILFELDKNSRQPLSKIARKVRLSKEAVYYRIKNLEKRKIILGYTIFASLAKLGLMHVKLLIKFQNINSKKKKEIIDYLVQHDKTNWVGVCHGAYDLLAGYVVRDLIEFGRVKQELLDRYSEYILNYQTSIMLEAYIYGRKFLLNKSQEIRHYIGTPEKTRLDDTDLSILRLLSENSRSKTTDIAAKLKTTARIAAYKIKNLEKKGIIQKYTISINHEKLGLSFFKSFIYLRNSEKKNILLQFLAGQKECLHNVDVLSEWNLEPEFEVYNTSDFYRIMEDIENRFSEDIKTIDTILITKEYKFRPLPNLFV